MRLEVLAAVTTKFTVFRDVTPCNLIDVNPRFNRDDGTCEDCLRHDSNEGREGGGDAGSSLRRFANGMHDSVPMETDSNGLSPSQNCPPKKVSLEYAFEKSLYKY